MEQSIRYLVMKLELLLEEQEERLPIINEKYIFLTEDISFFTEKFDNYPEIRRVLERIATLVLEGLEDGMPLNTYYAIERYEMKTFRNILRIRD